MKKIFTLLALLVSVCTGAWATDYHYVDLTTYDLTSNFRSALTQDNTSRVIDGNTFTSTRKFGSTASSLGNINDIGTKYIVYEVKSTVTNLDIYVYNTNSSDSKLYVAEVEEGASSATTTELTATKSTGTKLTYEVNSSKNCTLYFFVNNTKVLIGDIVAKETGTPLPTGGEAGFSMSLNKGRSAIKSGTTTVIENMEFYLSSNYGVLNSTVAQIKTKGTHYVKFTTTASTKVTVSVTSSTTYYISSTKNASESPAPTSYTSTAENVSLAAGTWYIVPNGSNVNITGLSFASNVTHSVTYDVGAGSGEAPTQADVAEGDKFTLASADGITAPAGKEFKCWNDGSADYNAGAEYTVGSSDVYLTAVYQDETVKYSINYSLGEGAGTVPTQSSLAEGAEFAVANAPGDLVPPANKTFKCWNDGTADYNPGDTYMVGTSPVVLTAQYKDISGTVIIRSDITSASASGKAATGTIGGTTSYTVQNSTVDGGYKFNSNAYASLTLASGTFKTGDIINIYITKECDMTGTIRVYDSSNAEQYNTGVKGVVGENAFVLPAELDGESTISVRRVDSTNDWNAYVKYIEVIRPGAAVTLIDLNANGFATYSSGDKFTVSGAEAYKMAVTLEETTVTGIAGTKIADGAVIPAGEGVLLKGGENAKVAIIASTADATAISGNDLKGTTKEGGATAVPATDASGKKVFVLNGDTFKYYTGAEFAENKAYLAIPDSYSLPDNLPINFGEVTAVQNVEAAPVANKAEIGKKAFVNGHLVIISENGVVNALGQSFK